MPERIGACVRHHHDPVHDVPDEARPLVSLVQIADWLSISERTGGAETQIPGDSLAATDLHLIDSDRNELARLLPLMSAVRVRATETLGLIAD